MTGIQLKEEIRKLGITQENAANKLGISLRQLQNWFKNEELDIKITHNVQHCLGINFEKSIDSTEDPNLSGDVQIPRELLSLLSSQQETIHSQQELINRLVKPDVSQ